MNLITVKLLREIMLDAQLSLVTGAGNLTTKTLTHEGSSISRPAASVGHADARNGTACSARSITSGLRIRVLLRKKLNPNPETTLAGQTESNLNFSFRLDWFSILSRWVELPILHCSNRFVSEAVTWRVFL